MGHPPTLSYTNRFRVIYPYDQICHNWVHTPKNFSLCSKFTRFWKVLLHPVDAWHVHRALMRWAGGSQPSMTFEGSQPSMTWRIYQCPWRATLNSETIYISEEPGIHISGILKKSSCYNINTVRNKIPETVVRWKKITKYKNNSSVTKGGWQSIGWWATRRRMLVLFFSGVLLRKRLVTTSVLGDPCDKRRVVL